MSGLKRNKYLDTDESDDNGHLSQENENPADSRTADLTARSSKRQKLNSSHSPIDNDSEADDTDVELSSSPNKKLSGSPPELAASSGSSPPTLKKKHITKSTTPITPRKPGVIYLSRIPPFMRPSTVKTLLSAHGPITKIFLTPEPPTTYLRRKKAGGNKKHSFIDGWVEFARKKHAKQCVDAINGQTVGGKKGGWYRDDVWNARYLRGFGWEDLMQGIRAEEREREEKVRVGTRREGRERGEFLRNLERSKVKETRRGKRERKLRREGGEDQDGDGEGLKPKTRRKEEGNDLGPSTKTRSFERTFRQNEVKGRESRQIDQPEEVKRVLSKIF